MTKEKGKPNLTLVTCRNSLRAAIAVPQRSRNWVQILFLGFCISGLSFNISSTAVAFFARMLAMPQAHAMAIAAGVFLFFWLATQAILWAIGVGALGRMLRGRAMTLGEALGDLFLRRA